MPVQYAPPPRLRIRPAYAIRFPQNHSGRRRRHPAPVGGRSDAGGSAAARPRPERRRPVSEQRRPGRLRHRHCRHRPHRGRLRCPAGRPGYPARNHRPELEQRPGPGQLDGHRHHLGSGKRRPQRPLPDYYRTPEQRLPAVGNQTEWHDPGGSGQPVRPGIIVPGRQPADRKHPAGIGAAVPADLSQPVL